MIRITKIRPADKNAKGNGYIDYVRSVTRRFLIGLGITYTSHVKGNTLEIVNLHKPEKKKMNPLDKAQRVAIAKELTEHLHQQAPLVSFKVEAK